MAGRVNTKFVIILSAVVVVLVGGIASVAYLSKRDANELAARGEQYLADGEIEQAVETLERAVNHSKSDPQIIKKYINAVKQKPAADHVEAGNILNIVLRHSQNLVQIDPNSETFLREYEDLVKDTSERMGGSTAYLNLIYQAAVERMKFNPGDELARRQRGYYGYLKLNVETPPEEIDEVRQDLLWAHAEYPQDAEVTNRLAEFKLFEARLMDRPGADQDQIQTLKDEAVALSQGVLDQDPDDAMLKLKYFLIVYRATVDAFADDPYEQVRPILEDLEAQLLEDPSPSPAVLTVVQRLKGIYYDQNLEEGEGDEIEGSIKSRNVGVRRAVALLRRAVEEHPEDGIYQLTLGTELKNVGEFELSLPYIQYVKDLSTEGHYLDVLLNDRLKQMAMIEYADLQITLGEMATDEADQKTKFDVARKIIADAVASGKGEFPKIQLLSGRLALAEGKIREGLISIDKAIDGLPESSNDRGQALVLSARARGQQGDWGSAADRYEQILVARPKLAGVRLALAGIYIRQQDFDAAQDHIDAVLVEEPMNEQALMQQAALYASQDQLDQAIDVYRQMDMNNRPDLAIGLARLLILGERKEQAKRMLTLYFDADPSNVQVLALLILSNDDLAENRKLIELSRAAGGDETMLAVMTRQLDPDTQTDTAEVIERFVEKETDPFVRAMSSARLYIRANKIEEAKAALARAEKLKPDDRQVIDLRFNFAINDQDMDTAQRYADRAAQMNLDEAGGRFYQAQIQSTKKDYKAAIETLRIALDEVPINSDGWRLLGEMYVETSNDSEAVAAFERSLKQRPDNLAAIRGLAAIRDRQGRYDEALGMLKFASNRYPNNEQLRQLYLVYEGKYGDKQAALRERREQLEAQPENANNKRSLAMLLAETGQHQQGLDMIQALIDDEGATLLNLQVLAKVHQYAGNADQGVLVLRQNILSRGADVNSADYAILARYQTETGDLQGAVQTYQTAIEVESDRREITRALAGLYFNRQAYAQALPYYRELHTQFPDELTVGLGLAEALIRTQQYEDAAAILDGVDGGATEQAQRALIAESRGDHGQAMTLVDAAIAADPGKSMFYYERAALRAKAEGREEDIVNDLNTALSLNPDYLLARRLLVAMHLKQNQKREAIREMTTLVSRHPEYPQGRLQLIQMHVNDGDITRAKSLARAGIKLTPDESAWYSVLGGLALREGEVQEAIDFYVKVMEMSPTPANLLNLVTVQIDNGRGTEAQALMREHAEIVNQQPLLQAVMGRALYASGKQDEARQVFVRSAERCTTFDHFYGVATQVRKDYSLAETITMFEGMASPPSDVWVELVLARLEMTDGETQAVVTRLAALESTLSAEDTGVRQMIEQMMGPALHDLGRAEEALAYYKRVRAYAPDNTSVLNNMAYLLVEDLGRPQEALPLAQRASELEPVNAQVLDTLGWIQFKLGQTDAAQQTLQRSIDAQALSANHLHMAELMIDKGYRVEADRHLRTAIDLAEQNNESQMLERAKELLKQTDEMTEASVNP